MGFRPGYSTDMVLINIKELMTEELHMYLAMAFDTVNHKILLTKLEFY